MSSIGSAVNVMNLFGDPTRVRLMALLAREELSVAEIVSITELAQPRVSTHLGRLREAGVLRDRRAGASTYYSLANGAMPDEARRLWALLEEDVKDAVLDADKKRCAAVLRARDGAAAWPDALAGRMERHYSPGRTWESLARALVGLVALGDVLDVGSGDGTIAEMLAPRARSVTCVDRSARMIEAALARLAKAPNARCVVGDAHALELPAASFDQVLLFNVLTHAETPVEVVAEAARVLRPGGSLVVTTLDAHDHEGVAAAYGHVHRGFRPAALRKMLARAGLEVELCDVTSREKREPYLQIVTAFAKKPASARRAPAARG